MLFKCFRAARQHHWWSKTWGRQFVRCYECDKLRCISRGQKSFHGKAKAYNQKKVGGAGLKLWLYDSRRRYQFVTIFFSYEKFWIPSINANYVWNVLKWIFLKVKPIDNVDVFGSAVNLFKAALKPN